MTGIGLARGASTLVLPAAVVVAWWRRRRQEVGGAVPAESTPRPAPPRRITVHKRELRALVREDADLSKLDLSGMSLAKWNLEGRKLAESDMSRARLSGARLRDADLSDATLDFADLSRADLRRADLSGVSLLETSLFRADLRGADLSRCRNLIMANLRQAVYDAATRWPGRVDARTLGAVLDKSGTGRRSADSGPGPDSLS